uniref:Prolycopene isomeraseic isoform X1 n=1 Tax=Rhizophora mucronata TaxID=61149 RepID=A0A2P2L459_RHIMU
MTRDATQVIYLNFFSPQLTTHASVLNQLRSLRSAASNRGDLLSRPMSAATR